MSRLTRERYGPWLLGILSAVLMYLSCKNGWVSPPSPNDEYLSSILSLGGVLTGFMATLKTMLYGLSDTVFEKLKSSGYLHDLRRYLKEAIFGSLATCVVTLICFHAPKQLALQALLIGVVAFSLASVARITKIGTALFSIR
jgi:hypothetical protein